LCAIAPSFTRCTWNLKPPPYSILDLRIITLSLVLAMTDGGTEAIRRLCAWIFRSPEMSKQPHAWLSSGNHTWLEHAEVESTS
ncbi:MAG: hypothetical protein ABI604_14145, partial [Nitrospirota bacterium]